MNILESLKDIFEEILDIDKNDITSGTYVIRELDAESIDLLELAVNINKTFNIKVVDSEIFLLNLRLFINEAESADIELEKYIAGKYKHLTMERIKEILSEIEHGPVLKISDIENYIKDKI